MNISDLRKAALFACQVEGCAEEVSNHAEDLKTWKGAAICADCFVDSVGDGPDLEWSDLPVFDPFEEIVNALRVGATALGAAARIAREVDNQEANAAHFDNLEARVEGIAK